jgi:hypothetical protein
MVASSKERRHGMPMGGGVYSPKSCKFLDEGVESMVATYRLF